MATAHFHRSAKSLRFYRETKEHLQEVNTFTRMFILTGFFAASLLNTHAAYVESLKSWSLPSSGSMDLQVTPHANWVGQPVRRVIPLRFIDPRLWFDRTPKNRHLRWEYWPEPPSRLVWDAGHDSETNAASPLFAPDGGVCRGGIREELMAKSFVEKRAR
jgi:hypothetical protein